MSTDKSKPLYGFYRAKVVDNKDQEDYGRVMVWIPDTMPKMDDSKGLWANPANNPISGLNIDGDSSSYYMGSSYIPPKGAWVWVFFENGRADKPFYFGGLDLQNSKVLPENRVGSDKYKKWVIFKSNEGRTIVVSDDSDDARTEITGKKRNLSEAPSGDTGSVYTVDGNQTTIFFDERDGKEKILIRTYKGDFFNIDIENQKLQVKFQSDIIFETEGSFFIKTGADFNIKSGGNINNTSSGDINNSAGGSINNDGSTINDQCSAASQASESTPEGDR